MVDSCAGCGYYRQRSYGNASVGECRISPPGRNGQHGQWAEVEEDDWCGEFLPQGATNTNIRGNLILTTTALVKLMDVGGDPTFGVADITAVQLTNTANQPGVVFFYDGNDNTKLVTQLGCPNIQSVQALFPQPLLALSGEIWVALNQGLSSMYVAAQGRKRRGTDLR